MTAPRVLHPSLCVLMVVFARDSTAQQIQPSSATMFPCCAIQSVDAANGLLVLGTSNSGERLRVSTPASRYRTGQIVDLNAGRTVMVLTPLPVEYAKKQQIEGRNYWTMRSRIILSEDGRLSGETTLRSTDASRGFVGGVEVLVVGRSSQILHQTILRKYGVRPDSSIISNWQESVPAAVLNAVRAVAIHHSYEPMVRLAASTAWIRDEAQTVTTRLTCTPVVTEKGGLSRSAGSSNPPSSIRCTE